MTTPERPLTRDEQRAAQGAAYVANGGRFEEDPTPRHFPEDQRETTAEYMRKNCPAGK